MPFALLILEDGNRLQCVFLRFTHNELYHSRNIYVYLKQKGWHILTEIAVNIVHSWYFYLISVFKYPFFSYIAGPPNECFLFGKWVRRISNRFWIRVRYAVPNSFASKFLPPPNPNLMGDKVRVCRQLMDGSPHHPLIVYPLIYPYRHLWNGKTGFDLWNEGGMKLISREDISIHFLTNWVSFSNKWIIHWNPGIA